jgi:hypothetical protein
VGVSGDEGDKKSSPNLGPWLTGGVTFLAAALAVVGYFVKITPFEIDTFAGGIAVVLVVVCLASASAAVWSHRHRKDRRRTALLATVAAVALIGGALTAIGSARGTSGSSAAGGAPTITTQTSTTSTTLQGGVEPDGSETGTGEPTRKSAGGSQDSGGSPHTTRSTAAAPNPTQPAGGPPPAPDAVRYQGEFRLSASQESVDLDHNPPAAYGDTNELAVDDHSIWPVPPDTTGVVVSGSPTRTVCVTAVDQANPPAEYFDNPQSGDVYCVRTSEGRYALVRVVSAATKDFTLALTVWN